MLSKVLMRIRIVNILTNELNISKPLHSHMRINGNTIFLQQCPVRWKRTIAPIETILFGETKRKILRVTRMLHRSFQSLNASSPILEKLIRENYFTASCLHCRAQLRATFKIRLCLSQHSKILWNFTRLNETSSTAILWKKSIRFNQTIFYF